MKLFIRHERTTLIFTTMVAVFLTSTFAQTDETLVPFLVNVDATVSVTDGVTPVQITVTTDEETIMRLPLTKTSEETLC